MRIKGKTNIQLLLYVLIKKKNTLCRLRNILPPPPPPPAPPTLLGNHTATYVPILLGKGVLFGHFCWEDFPKKVQNIVCS